MQPIARCNLRGLHCQSLAETVQLLFQLGALPNQLPECLRVAPVGRAISLGYQSRGTAAVSHKQWQTDEPFVANKPTVTKFPTGLNAKVANLPSFLRVAHFVVS